MACIPILGLVYTSCVETDSTTITSERYTRGIGVYPGDPTEDFAPLMIRDNKNYRNIALNRKVYQSSSFDYNLTSQLLTDGIISNQMPQYMVMKTNKGEVSRREKEWTLDDGPFSKNSLEGNSTFIQYELNNYSVKIDEVRVKGKIIYDDNVQSCGYSITCYALSPEGEMMKIGEVKNRPVSKQKDYEKVKITDANKMSVKVNKPVSEFFETITLPHIEKSYSNLKIQFQMEGALRWDILETKFMSHEQACDIKSSRFFTSAWMPAGHSNEWVYVDLGSISEFDSIKLFWLKKAAKGVVEVSDDAVNWKEIARLPETNVLQDEIKVKAKSRYVRILMNDQDRYILSEIEIYGKGGLVAQPVQRKQVKGNRLMLSGGEWKLQRASLVNESGDEIAQQNYKCNDWLYATVPGTVFTSYMNIGAVPSPLYSDHQLVASESFFNSNFWYRKEFSLPKNYKQENVFLNFDGINWKANVYLNGQNLGRIEGAFMRGQFNVTGLLKEGENVLAVEIEKNKNIGAVKEQNRYSPDFNGGILGADNPTFHASIGWDWIPTVRGRNIGIWNDVYLITAGKVTLADPYVNTEMALPDTTQARLTAAVVLTNHSASPLEGILKGSIGDIKFEKTVRMNGDEEKTIIFTPDDFSQLEVKHPHLWWPNGYGNQYLYDANFSFYVDGTMSDTKNYKVGIRQMTYNDDNGILNMYVNGRRFVAKGGNWGFSELNLNYRKREYETAVAYHKDMNFTMIRNWVGMIGDEEFYDACDKYGIMVWQDFWLANPVDGPNPDDNSLFMKNAENYVKRIRSHASIGLYCGRNEGFPPASLDQGLRQLVKAEHSGLHYIPSSAHNTVSGFGPYRMLPPKDYFSLGFGNEKLHSERGMPNVMTYESLKRTLVPESLWPQCNEWGIHDYTLQGAQWADSFNQILAEAYGEPQSAKDFCDLAQWVNYDGHRAMFESRSNYRMGLLMWMSHPCWPSMVWQTYDYFFEPTAAYFAIKKAAEPLHIQWNQYTNDVEVVNYSAGLKKRLLAKAVVYNLNGSIAWEKEMNIDSEEDSTVKLFKLQFPESSSEVVFVKLYLTDAEDCISDNFYLYSKKRNDYKAINTLFNAKLNIELHDIIQHGDDCSAKVKINNNSCVPALMIRLNVVGKKDNEQILPVIYSDNYFSLMPNETKHLTLSWKAPDSRGNAPKLKVSGFNVNESSSL